MLTLEASSGLLLEARFPEETAADLARRDHSVVHASAWETALSRARIVGREPDRGLMAAPDLRSEGCALGW